VSLEPPGVREGLLQAIGEYDYFAADGIPVGLQTLQHFLRSQAALISVEDIRIADWCQQVSRLIETGDISLGIFERD
jgi:hypothetical protein